MSLLLYANTDKVEISTETHFVRSDSVILAPKGIWNQKKQNIPIQFFLFKNGVRKIMKILKNNLRINKNNTNQSINMVTNLSVEYGRTVNAMETVSRVVC